MKKLKELRSRFIMSWAQPMADFLIQRLETSQDNQEFETWFNIALYLDLYCTKKGVYLN
jgi:hypothetical protein